MTQKNYKNILVEDFIVKQNYENSMEIPTIQKIVLNISTKQSIIDKKNNLPVLLGLELLSGQKSSFTKAKKSIASFKVRKNQTIGAKVTLRKLKKDIFFEKLLRILLPRVNEYSGTSRFSFDKKGNSNIGIDHILIFPELENFFQYFEKIKGIQLSIQVQTKRKEESIIFFSGYQLPIK